MLISCNIQENPLYGKFIYKGLAFANDLTTLFKDVVANGKFSWVPSFGILPNDIGEDDVYRPCFESGDIEEGSGDSEEIIPTSAGMSSELRNINLSTSEGSNSERSIGKRKRVGASEKNESKNVKAPASKKIAEAISRIASTSESRSNALNTLVVLGTSIPEVMDELDKIIEITSDDDWHARCSQLMLSKSAREMFVALKGHKQRLLGWLKYAAYNALPSMKS
ncbi:uncharacterized protein LOC109796407 [Cajanus cajan]|uniref:uncharacterized protein LOC109796407 n=1 Tax=Cajanus cajan TaxID=3821 RepID=UPI00098D8729|nr:uncharacterized protein LOC109796407 [Cajanus cajan]